MHQEEASTLLQSRQDLYLYKQAKAVEPHYGNSQKDISELELFSGFAVNPFSKATLNEWTLGNVKLILTYFKNTSLCAVVERAPAFGRKLFPFLITMLLAVEEERIKEAMEKTVSFVYYFSLLNFLI